MKANAQLPRVPGTWLVPQPTHFSLRNTRYIQHQHHSGPPAASSQAHKVRAHTQCNATPQCDTQSTEQALVQALPQLSGRALLLWDIENVGPFAPLVTLPVQLQRIKALLLSSGCSDVQVLVALNPRSLARAKAVGLLALLQACGVLVIQTPQHADAADVALISVGQRVIQQHREAWCSTTESRPGNGSTSAGINAATLQQANASQTWSEGALQGLVVVCLTQDTRFNQLLAYATDRGIYTVVMAPFQQGLRTAAAAMAHPVTSMKQNSLARASCAAVKWLPVNMTVTRKERDAMQHAQCIARQLFEEPTAGCSNRLLDIDDAYKSIINDHSGVQTPDHAEQMPVGAGECAVHANLPRMLSMDVLKLTCAPGQVQHVWLNPAVHARQVNQTVCSELDFPS